jgi:hypothetical protein
MSDKETGGSAFPNEGGAGNLWNGKGMTLRQYAAIKLKVPDSGTEWLDAMIEQSLRDDFAAKAMQAYISAYPCQALEETLVVDYEPIAGDSYEMADAMLKARKS